MNSSSPKLDSPTTLQATLARPLITLLFAAILVCNPTAETQAQDAKPQPYHGKPHTIPGLIEAEHWDKGPSGVAYVDTTPANQGEDYREKTQVDIEKRPDASNGHGLGWIREKEWLIYTVKVTQPGKYRIEMPVASPKLGGLFRIEMNGKDVTGPIRLSKSGDWKKLVLLNHKKVQLKKGTFQMKVVMIKNGESGAIGDIDYFKFAKE